MACHGSFSAGETIDISTSGSLPFVESRWRKSSGGIVVFERRQQVDREFQEPVRQVFSLDTRSMASAEMG
jgi:hypothetical protein